MLCLFGLFETKAQYISELLDYTPAPGQLINVFPWGTPAGAESIIGGMNGTLSLGSFGGYVVFQFKHPVENDPRNPYGVDFTIFGNPMAGWSEPGVVWVMKDENENKKADDTWYVLAGSDYWFSSTRLNYQVRYTNPGGSSAADVPWEDQWGNTGVIRANSLHTQTYYPMHDIFPAVDPVEYTLNGIQIQGMVYEHPTGMISVPRAFGYADNLARGTEPYTLPDNPYTREPENSGGDAFDIGWAVDSTGNYVDLDQVHFIKVQNGLLADGGRLGELSTELSGAVDVPPDPSITGETALVVIRDLPPLIQVHEYQLELSVFRSGRLDPDANVKWTTSHAGAEVDEDNILRLTAEGPVTVTASLIDLPEITASVSTTADFEDTFVHGTTGPGPLLYPNPTSGIFRIRDCQGVSIHLYDSSGKMLIRLDHYQDESVLDIRTLPDGIYSLLIIRKDNIQWVKLVKR
jgi:hypothetical protein